MLTCSKEPAKMDVTMESIITEAMDSLYCNNAYSRSLLRDAMNNTNDSLDYYKALQTYSLTYFVNDQIDSTRHFAEKVVAYANKQVPNIKIYQLLTSSYNTIGNCFALYRDQDSALTYFTNALNYYELTGKREKIPDLSINIADMHMRNGDFVNSAFYYRKALSVADSIGVADQLGFPIYTGLGQLYMELRDFELSDYYFCLAEQDFEGRTLNEKFFYCNCRGNCYFFAGELQESLSWYKKGITLLSGEGSILSLNIANANIGEIFFHLNQPDSAYHYLNEAEKYFSAINEQPLLYHINTLKAGLALQADNPQHARHYLEGKVTNLTIEPTFLILRNKYIEQYHARTGNFKEAYACLQENLVMEDSIRSERAKMRVAEIDMRYRQDTTLVKREMLIMGQASDIRSLRMRNYIFVMAFLLISAIMASVYIAMKRQKELQRLSFHDQITKLRLSNIRNRISPHFMFNVLNREISSDNGSHPANLMKLVLLLRRSLEMTDQAQVTLNQELEFVEAYINLERESLGPDFKLDWNIDPHVDTEMVSLPSMIIQIPLENAIKHALRPLAGEKKLELQVRKEGEGTRIEIIDNGTGYQELLMGSSTGTGTGLKVLYQTIDLFNRENSEKIQFNILRSGMEEQGGTRVTIFIPDNYKYW
jgi:tetratricopeptide (TPR) repeat protein